MIDYGQFENELGVTYPTRLQSHNLAHPEIPPAWFNNLAHLDQLLATWEWRSGATPWLVMKANITDKPG